MSSVPALELNRLTKAYRSASALEEVSLKIDPGEIFALLGPNGAGKTTLIGIVCGLVKKTGGQVLVNGVDLDVDPVSPRYRIGLVPQEINFDPFFTVTESLEIQLGYYGQRVDPGRIAEVLDALSLSSKAKARTRELSGGMKRRLLIAKALVHRPSLLFLDEPTAGVDIELRRDLWRYVRRLKAEGTTIVLTTHYLEEAEELADRIGVLNQGKLLLVERTGAILAKLGETRLLISLHSPLAKLPEGLLSSARLDSGGRSIIYIERAGGVPAGDVLSEAYRAGLPIAAVETRRSSLEEVLSRLFQPSAGASR